MIVHRASIPAYNISPSVYDAARSCARWSAQRLLNIFIFASLEGVSTSAVHQLENRGTYGRWPLWVQVRRPDPGVFASRVVS